MSKDKIIGVVGHTDHGKTTLSSNLDTAYPPKYTAQGLKEIIDQEIDYELKRRNRSLADAIIETTTNLKGKQLSARALRRAEARKLKPKYR